MQRTNFEYGSPYLTMHHIIIIIINGSDAVAVRRARFFLVRPRRINKHK